MNCKLGAIPGIPRPLPVALNGAFYVIHLDAGQAMDFTLPQCTWASQLWKVYNGNHG